LNKKQIVILGAGYGGLHTALKLERLLKRDANWRICARTHNSINSVTGRVCCHKYFQRNKRS
jgi:NADH dehydrogenase FAD-containing subunit